MTTYKIVARFHVEADTVHRATDYASDILPDNATVMPEQVDEESDPVSQSVIDEDDAQEVRTGS